MVRRVRRILHCIWERQEQSEPGISQLFQNIEVNTHICGFVVVQINFDSWVIGSVHARECFAWRHSIASAHYLHIVANWEGLGAGLRETVVRPASIVQSKKFVSKNVEPRRDIRGDATRPCIVLSDQFIASPFDLSSWNLGVFVNLEELDRVY